MEPHREHRAIRTYETGERLRLGLRAGRQAGEVPAARRALPVRRREVPVQVHTTRVRASRTLRTIRARDTDDPDIGARSLLDEITTHTIEHRVRTLLVAVDLTHEEHHRTTGCTEALGEDRGTGDTPTYLQNGRGGRTRLGARDLRRAQEDQRQKAEHDEQRKEQATKSVVVHAFYRGRGHRDDIPGDGVKPFERAHWGGGPRRQRFAGNPHPEDGKETPMAQSQQRLTVLGETFEFNAETTTVKEIAESIENVLAEGADRKFFHALRTLMLRQADTIEPEGAPRCDLIRHVLSEPALRQRIIGRSNLTPETPRLTAVDLSYGQLVTLGSYQQGGMKYTPVQAKTVHVIALWIGDGVTVGRGYELVESPYRIPVEAVNVYRKPVYTFEQDLSTEQRETLRTLMRDGMNPREALETATLL